MCAAASDMSAPLSHRSDRERVHSVVAPVQQLSGYMQPSQIFYSVEQKVFLCEQIYIKVLIAGTDLHTLAGTDGNEFKGRDLTLACVQGLVALHTNPVLADSTAGLATTATAFAAIEVSEQDHLCCAYALAFVCCLVRELKL